MNTKNTGKTGHFSLLQMIFYLWAGMIIGISFLEAPLKFQAPNITLPLGLGIGRLVFGALNKIEILFAAGILGILFFRQTSTRFRILATIVFLMLLAQSTWLLPALDSRAEHIIQGGIPEASSLHFYYVGMESIKLIVLLILGFLSQSEASNIQKLSYGNS